MFASSADPLTATSCRPSTLRPSSRRVNTFCSLLGRCRQTLRKKVVPCLGLIQRGSPAATHAGTTKAQFCYKKMSTVYRRSPASPFCRAQAGVASQDQQRLTKQMLCLVSCLSPHKPPNSAFNPVKIPHDVYFTALFLTLDSRVATSRL